MEKEGEKSSKKVFQIMREITGKWVPKTDAIKHKTGRTLTESDNIKRRLAEYCLELYEGDDEEQMEEIIYESMEPAPLLSEVEWALNQLRSRKSPGIDNIPIEMWKASGEEGFFAKAINRAARFVANSSYDASASPLLSELEWLSLDEIIKGETTNMVYKSINSLAPKYLYNLFTKSSSRDIISLRSSETDLYIPFMNTKNSQKSLFFTVVPICGMV